VPVAAILALLSSVLWGSSDFAGGLLCRRLPVMVVIAASQFAALIAAAGFVVASVAVCDGGLAGSALGWGAVSGFAGMVGLICFYSALASGAMGVVAPIASMGAAVPLVVGLVRGDRPSVLQAVGIAVALVGVVLVARVPVATDSATASRLPREVHRRSVVLAGAAAAGFGLALLAIAEAGGGQQHGRFEDVLAGLLSQRIVNVGVAAVGLLVLRRRRTALTVSPSLRLPLVAVGLVDIGSNTAYGFASLHGLVSVVSVLASLYPVVTILLARTFLAERLAGTQLIGVGATLGGVILLAVG